MMDVGPWAEEKLDCIRKYLSAYTTILKDARFSGYFYIDAFAGPGSLKVRPGEDPAQSSLLESPEYARYLAGSPRVALEIKYPFTDYVFVERDPVRVAQLKELQLEYSARRNIHIREQDCNSYLDHLLSERRPWRRWRGVVFLDPFGMHVPWNTIAKIGGTRAIEVIINFPLGMAIQRLLPRDGQFTPKRKQTLNDYFGTDEWFDLVYDTQTDMFGRRVVKRQESADILIKWYKKRLEEVFGYVSTAREIQSTSGRPLYYLIFAGPNKTGARIADHVLRQGARIVR